MTSLLNLNTNITPIKVGVKFQPPAIILVYRDKSSLRKRKIPAKNLDILTDIKKYVEEFKSDPKYKRYFEKISQTKLEKIFFILQDNMKGYNLDESLVRAKKFDVALTKKIDNTLSESNLSIVDDDLDTSLFAARKVEETILSKKYDDDDYEMDDDEEEIQKKYNMLKLDDKKNDDDDNDFHDTEDEEEISEKILADEDEEKNPPSVSTIEDVKAKKEIIEAKQQNSLPNLISKSSALDLLSTQLKSVKTNIYDFEEDNEIEEEILTNNEDDQDDKSGKLNDDDKIETANHDDSRSDDSSF